MWTGIVAWKIGCCQTTNNILSHSFSREQIFSVHDKEAFKEKFSNQNWWICRSGAGVLQQNERHDLASDGDFAAILMLAIAVERRGLQWMKCTFTASYNFPVLAIAAEGSTPAQDTGNSQSKQRHSLEDNRETISWCWVRHCWSECESSWEIPIDFFLEQKSHLSFLVYLKQLETMVSPLNRRHFEGRNRWQKSFRPHPPLPFQNKQSSYRRVLIKTQPIIDTIIYTLYC